MMPPAKTPCCAPSVLARNCLQGPATSLITVDGEVRLNQTSEVVAFKAAD